MNIAVFASPTSWHYRDLLRAAGAAHQLTPVAYEQLMATVGSAGAELRSGDALLNGFDAALVRSMPPAALEPIIFRMNALARLEAAGVPVINPPRAVEAAIDKYLTTALLAGAGLLVPRTFACQTVDDALAAFDRLGGDAVVKPVYGAEGRGLVRLTDRVLAVRAFTSLARFGSLIYLQQFVPHAGRDFRLLVVGDEVWGMQRTNHDDWRSNISCGGTGGPLDVTPELASAARRAAAAVGASVAGVDLLPGEDGQLYALEVNASPGWRALSAVAQVDVAACVLNHVADYVEERTAIRGD
ncbi:MAG: 30S ribosomal protein S6--L-glutamate ligase [Planctomycetaceae bacterium]|nr:30S ribosomal protein S6--L-glutamate ligase [Planctomycetaceae bacterium]